MAKKEVEETQKEDAQDEEDENKSGEEEIEYDEEEQEEVHFGIHTLYFYTILLGLVKKINKCKIIISGNCNLPDRPKLI